jgi:hypothetical protein
MIGCNFFAGRKHSFTRANADDGNRAREKK